MPGISGLVFVYIYLLLDTEIGKLEKYSKILLHIFGYGDTLANILDATFCDLSSGYTRVPLQESAMRDCNLTSPIEYVKFDTISSLGSAIARLCSPSLQMGRRPLYG